MGKSCRFHEYGRETPRAELVPGAAELAAGEVITGGLTASGTSKSYQRGAAAAITQVHRAKIRQVRHGQKTQEKTFYSPGRRNNLLYKGMTS